MSIAKKIETPDARPHLRLANASETIVQGPFESQRFGRYLMINPLGTGVKVCSFNCAYCDLGNTELRLNKIKQEVTFPSVESIGAALTAALKSIHTHGPTIDRLVISGNGEPTLHPEFPDVVRAILSARDQWAPGKPVAVLTSGALLDTRKIAEALNRLDERIVKVDVGNEKMFKAFNAPLSRTSLSRVLNGIRLLKDVTVQSLFVQGTVDNTKPADLDDWIEAIAIIKPKAVQIHTISRPTTVEGLKACDEDTLYTIASRLERKTQIKAAVGD